jgi:hypothetical protein
MLFGLFDDAGANERCELKYFEHYGDQIHVSYNATSKKVA